ncbi:MAG: caspase family protein [Anaerolineae bacterium]|nr:caspase family protein [Anaerolineae bacterium]
MFDKGQALVVGIAGYRHIHALPPTVLKDARDIYDLLVDPRHCGYAPENVRLLLDGEATQAGLRKALADLAARSDPDSTVFLYVSCHGGRIESGPHAGEYLLPVDAVYTSTRSLAQTAVSGAEFTEALRAIPARKVVVVFDCCHSGGIGQPKEAAAPGLKAGLPESYYEALKAGRGRVILASSRSDEVSWVLPGAENSLFTQHLLAGLRGGIPSDDGLIRIFDLFEYLQPRVTGDQPQQHPIFKAELEENFPVALRLGGQPKAPPTDEQGFRYDAYVSYADREPDRTWVWETLLPRLEAAGLRVAVSGDVEEPGVARVVGIERGIRQAKRTVLVLSEAYLADRMADFENVLAQTMSIQEGSYRLLPVRIGPLDEGRLPVRLGMLTTLDLAHPRRAEREFDRLLRALQGPLPRR